MFTVENSSELNSLLEKEQSCIRLQWALQGDHCECLVGEVNPSVIDEFKVYRFTQQYCSSFRLKIPMVAMINHFEISLREPCIHEMMKLKWEPILRYQMHTNISLDKASLSSYSVGDYLRSRTIKLYSHFKEPLTHIQNDCETNVLYHELGHAVIQHHLMKAPYGAIAECFQVFSPINVVIMILECLADLAPEEKNKAGSLTFLWRQASQNNTKAKAGLAMYFSDTWFFDTDETALMEYSEVLCLIMLKSLQQSPQACLELFSKDPHSLLQQWMNYIYKLIDEFCHLFLTSKQRKKYL